MRLAVGYATYCDTAAETVAELMPADPEHQQVLLVALAEALNQLASRPLSETTAADIWELVAQRATVAPAAVRCCFFPWPRLDRTAATLTREINSIIIDSMNTEWSSSVRERAQLHAALGEPTRLAIVDCLVLGDASPTEIGRELGLPSNLLAHHLKLLEQAGVIERSRSEGDHRRIYLRLRHEPLAGRLPADMRTAPRVVFVCTHNSARSQLAAALWAQRSTVPAASGGTHPAARVHPRAAAVAHRCGLSLARARTARVDEVLHNEDLVVAVCDNAHEELASHVDRLHWSVPDPARVDTDDAFDHAFIDLATRIDRLAPAVRLPGNDHD